MCFLSQSTGRVLQQTVPVQSAVVEKKKSAYFYCLKVGWLDILSKLSIYFFLSVILSNFFSFFIETLVLPLSVIVFFYVHFTTKIGMEFLLCHALCCKKDEPYI